MSEPVIPSFHLRLPLTLQKRVKHASVESERSMNAEIVARLERSFADDDEGRAEAIRLLTDALSILDRGQK